MDDQQQQPQPQTQPSSQPYRPSSSQPEPPQPAQPMPQQAQAQPAQDQSQRSPLRIDDNLLVELGLGSMPADDKSGFLKHIYETLEMRVGMRLADQMTNEQLDEFETFYNAKDDAGAFRWLETNFPNYKDIVADEFQKLKGEIAGQAPQILAASQQPQPQPMDQNPPQDYQQPPEQPPAGPYPQ